MKAAKANGRMLLDWLCLAAIVGVFTACDVWALCERLSDPSGE